MKSRIQQGLEIFTEQWGDWDIIAEHDQIWVHPKNHINDDTLRQDVVDQLDELGWTYDDGWSHFT